MTTQTVHVPRTGDLPGPSDEAAWTANLITDIAQVPPCQSVAELVDTYGTADPDWLRACCALPDDIAAAERLAAEARVAA